MEMINTHNNPQMAIRLLSPEILMPELLKARLCYNNGRRKWKMTSGPQLLT
jgi:hypothetical protein